MFNTKNWILLSTPITRTLFNSNCFSFPFRIRVTGILPVAKFVIFRTNGATLNVTNSRGKAPTIRAALVGNFRRWTIALRLSLSALWTFQVLHISEGNACTVEEWANECYINITRNTFISKTSRSCNGPADDKNGIYSSPTEIISEVNLFALILCDAPSQKLRVRVTGDGTICVKNSTFNL